MPWFPASPPLLDRTPWELPVCRDLLSQAVPPFPRRADGLASERERLRALGLPDSVVNTMQESCAPFTRAAYDYRWGLFPSWCAVHRLDPHGATVDAIQQFLKSQLKASRTVVTLRGMVAVITLPWSLSTQLHR